MAYWCFLVWMGSAAVWWELNTELTLTPRQALVSDWMALFCITTDIYANIKMAASSLCGPVIENCFEGNLYLDIIFFDWGGDENWWWEISCDSSRVPADTLKGNSLQEGATVLCSTPLLWQIIISHKSTSLEGKKRRKKKDDFLLDQCCKITRELITDVWYERAMQIPVIIS